MYISFQFHELRANFDNVCETNVKAGNILVYFVQVFFWRWRCIALHISFFYSALHLFQIIFQSFSNIVLHKNLDEGGQGTLGDSWLMENIPLPSILFPCLHSPPLLSAQNCPSTFFFPLCSNWMCMPVPPAWEVHSHMDIFTGSETGTYWHYVAYPHMEILYLAHMNKGLPP